MDEEGDRRIMLWIGALRHGESYLRRYILRCCRQFLQSVPMVAQDDRDWSEESFGYGCSRPVSECVTPRVVWMKRGQSLRQPTGMASVLHTTPHPGENNKGCEANLKELMSRRSNNRALKPIL